MNIIEIIKGLIEDVCSAVIIEALNKGTCNAVIMLFCNHVVLSLQTVI